MDFKSTFLSPENLNDLSKAVNSFQNDLKELGKQLGDFLEDLPILEIPGGYTLITPEEFKKDVIDLANNGWFCDIDSSLRETNEIAELYRKGNNRIADKRFINIFEKKISSLKKDLKNSSPNRYKIISTAIKAHQRKEYVLSIPVLLSQGDGIICDLLGESYFRRNNKGVLKTSEKAKELIRPDYHSDILLYIFTEKIPLLFNENDRKDIEDFKYLNRHQVLHGESLDYGTKINSSKAISFICFSLEMYKWYKLKTSNK